MAAPKRYPEHRFVSLSTEAAQEIKQIAQEAPDSESGIMRRAIDEFLERQRNLKASQARKRPTSR